jgi:hypothetical protein
MLHPSHSSRIYHAHTIGRWVQIMKVLIMKFSPLPCTSSLLGTQTVKNYPLF